MKTINNSKFSAALLGIALFIAPAFTYAQTFTDALFDKYGVDEDYTTIHITQHMFELFAEVDSDEENDEFLEAVKQIDRIKILVTEDKAKAKKLYEEAISEMKKSGIDYKDLMIVKEGDEMIKFMVHKKSNAKVAELLMIMYDGKEAVIMSIYGDIDLKKIAALSKSMNINGFQHLEKLEDEKNEK